LLNQQVEMVMNKKYKKIHTLIDQNSNKLTFLKLSTLQKRNVVGFDECKSIY